MSDQSRGLADCLMERTRLVGQISELHGRLTRLAQVAGGAEIGLMQEERDLSAGLAAARQHHAETQAAIEACETEISAHEARMAEIDREIENLTQQQG